MEEYISFKYIIAALVYSSLGIAILLAGYWVVEKITPENVWKEVIENKNMAMAIVLAGFIIGISIIISSAIHG